MAIWATVDRALNDCIAVIQHNPSSLVNIATWVLISLVVRSLILATWRSIPWQGYPVYGQEKWDLFRYRTGIRLAVAGRSIFEDGYKKYRGKIFQVFGPRSAMLVLPPEKYMDELKSHPSLKVASGQELFHYGYSSFKELAILDGSNVFLHTVSRKLIPSLALITEPVNDENHMAIPLRFPPTEEWTRVKFLPQTMEVVSQVSSRIFVGAPLCRNPEWIKIAKMYTVEVVTIAVMMNMCPAPLRPLFHWFSPSVKNLKKTIAKARELLQPEVDRRRIARAEALARGEKIPNHLDTIDWMMEVADAEHEPDFDVVSGQLVMSFAAVHTTSQHTATLMYELIEHPELIDEVRKEIIQAYTEDGGWKKTTLHKFRLLDSIMKEAQRVNTSMPYAMTRHVTDNITLSDGQVIPKGAVTCFTNLHMNEDATFPNANEFDGYRFLNLRRQPGNESRWQFVTTTTDHLAFGHGQHSCPGRFFASSEIKLIIAHLLLKYDWKFVDGKKPAIISTTATLRRMNPNVEIMYKSRTPEIDFVGLTYTRAG